jgi:hypothetical protein
VGRESARETNAAAIGLRRFSGIVGLFFLCVGAIAIAAPDAMAAYSTTGHFAASGSFGGEGGPGKISFPHRAVVEASTGDLYVADSGNRRVEIFSPNGETGDYLTEIGGNTGPPLVASPFGLAIDESGPDTVLYVSDPGDEQIHKLVSDGAAVPTFTDAPGFTSPAQGAGAGEIVNFADPLAVDPTTGDLLVADPGDNLVKRFSPTGAFLGSFDGSTAPEGKFTGLLDLAADSSGDLVVIDSPTGQVSELIAGGSSKIERFDASGAYVSTLGPVEGAGALGIDQNTDEVFVVGNFASVNNRRPLHVTVFGSDDSQLESFDMAPTSKEDVATGVAIAQGPAHRLYVVDDQAELFKGLIAIEAFEQPVPGPPVATVGALAQTPTTTTAKLEGEVDPNALQTSFYFEYGTTTTYGLSTPESHEGNAGSGIIPAPVSRFIGGLQPATTYHYRLIAHNVEGTSTSADATFVTAPLPSSEATASTRGYEMVSPPQKNNNDVLTEPKSVRADLSGNSAVFGVFGAFGEVESNAGNTGYRSVRGIDGSWASKGIVPPVTSGAFSGSSGFVRGFSQDLSREVITSKRPLTPEADSEWNLYLRDNETGKYTLITPEGNPNSYTYAGASADFNHILFESPIALLPGDPTPTEGTGENLYEWDSGLLRLVSVLPDPDGAGPGTEEPDPNGGYIGQGARFESFNLNQNVISEDGSKVFWTDAKTGQLYMRVNGTSTVQVSAPQGGAGEPNGTQYSFFQAATPDGSRVFFATCAELTPDSTLYSRECGSFFAATFTNGDLYEYDTEDGELTDLTPTPGTRESGGTLGLIGASADGSYVYFASRDALAEGATAVPDSTSGFDYRPNLYVSHEGHIRYIGQTSGSIQAANNFTPSTGNGSNWKLSAVTPDGRYALLWSEAPLTSYDTGGHGEFYRYDFQSNETICLSCSPLTVRSGSEATSTEESGSGIPQSVYEEFLGRSFTADGRAFFSTRDALVPQDTNGAVDAYETDPQGRPHLISSGKSPYPSYFMDASVSGNDVFFNTRERLVKADVDNNVDLYDARVGGGEVEAIAGTADCEGDACQSPVVPPNDPTPASLTFNGPGNQPPHHKKKQHKKKNHTKKQQKKKHGGSRRHSHTTRKHG